jgi:N-acetylglucosaminyl-diphospho-decaprenol L-rhamnosyltransferase
MELSIALVNWNNRDYLRQCLESIEAAQLPFSYDIVVADNGSTDGSLQMLSERFPYVKIVQNEGNVGVARGNNQCINNTNGRYIYILNNDTLVNRKAIETMMRFIDEHPDAGAVGGTLLNADGTYQSSSFSFPSLLEEFLIVSHIGARLNPYFPSQNGPYPGVREVDWISSASILVRREALEEIGLIDEEYFIYSDETDWQYRLWHAGWKVYYLPEVTTIHFGGGSFSPGDKRYTLVYRGRMLFARKHYSPFYCVLQRSMFALAALLRLSVWIGVQASRRWRTVAQKQIASNLETVKLCVRLV